VGRHGAIYVKGGEGAEEALLSSEQELRLLVDTIPTLVWTAGPEGDIEYVNKRVLEYLGATLDETIGNGWVERVHPDDVAFKTRTLRGDCFSCGISSMS
jgi:PAS domain S-box-containing protein